MKQSTFTVGMRDAQDNYKEVVVTLLGDAHLYDNNNDADAPAFDAFCVAAESLAQDLNAGFEATSCRLQALDSANNQNRTADGRFATAKEAQRTDCKEMIARYRAEAKAALHTNVEFAKRRLAAIAELRAAFFADYAEAV